MQKVKKISVRAFDKIMKETYTPFEVIKWNDIEITITKNLTLKEMLSFVDSVVRTCFDYDTGTYMPEVKDFAIKSNILERYANFTLPNDLEHRYSLIYNTDIVEIIVQNINTLQYDEITSAIDNKLSNFVTTHAEVLKNQIEKMLGAFDGIQKQLAETFSGVNPEDVTSLVNNLSKYEVNENNIIKTYIEQTTNKSGEN